MSETSVAISNLVLPEAIVVAGSANQHEDILDATDADGYLWNAVRSLRGAVLLRPNRTGEKLAERGRILALQESWVDRTYRDIAAQLKSGEMTLVKALKEAAYATVFPTLEGSHDPLHAIAEHAPFGTQEQIALIVHPPEQRRALPRVAHPEVERLNAEQPPKARPLDIEGFENVIFQPTVEQMRAANIDPNAPVEVICQKLREYCKAYGFKGVAIDVHHLSMVRNGEIIEEEKRTAIVQKLVTLGLAQQVQLACQPGFGGDLKDLRLLIAGRWEETPQGRLFIAAREAWSRDVPFLAAVEVTAAAIRAAGYTDYKSVLKDMIEKIRSL